MYNDIKTLHLGAIQVPIDEYASQGNAVLGIRGSGKSYTATYVAERLLDAGIPIVAFDPIGIWRFLRVPAQPGPGGYKIVVAGGEHGDIPLPASGAGEIMRAAMQQGISVVFDLYDIHLSKGDWRRVVESAVKVLLYENKPHGLRHVFLEEAAEFAPQRVGPDQGAVYSAIERLARMGGNAQLGYTLINQRAEEVNKAVLELCDLLVLHRQKGRNSLTALGKWLDIAQTKGAIAREIPALGNGECYVWPAADAQPVRTKIPAKRTFHPDRRAARAAPAEAKAADVLEFVTGMRESLERVVAEAEENDPKRLRAKVTELERALAEASSTHPVGEDELERARLKGFEECLRSALASIDPQASRLSALNAQLSTISTELATVHLALATAFHERPAPSERPAPTMVASVVPRCRVPVAVSAGGRSGGADGLPPGEHAVLVAAAQFGGVERDQLSVLTGYKRSSRDAYIQRLRDKGLVLLEGGTIVCTGAGRKALGSSFEPLPTGSALQDYWLARLPEGECKVLSILIHSYPRPVAREKIDAATGYARSSRDAYLQRLKSRRLVELPSRGEARAARNLFESP